MMLRPLMGTLSLAGGDDDELAQHFGKAVAIPDADVVAVHKSIDAVNDVHPIALELVLGYATFVFDHTLNAEQEVRHRGGFPGSTIGTVEILGVKAGKVQEGLAPGLVIEGFIEED
jgi:hypothetical protein